ncbi:hypothetical protein SCLCIDRAFT_1208095 [Scleroderma citrinum Foug A]|uniref:Uncharacterized protein n=1 Tax=Scleroderma citrinum Foug A TaxID=1036808 RepID=A0A0C3AXD0_9AGAM|nr:hypothetical protein SCLCIDRAFT_1208095 [Scleroderma citrinum Foug A]
MLDQLEIGNPRYQQSHDANRCTKLRHSDPTRPIIDYHSRPRVVQYLSMRTFIQVTYDLLEVYEALRRLNPTSKGIPLCPHLFAEVRSTRTPSSGVSIASMNALALSPVSLHDANRQPALPIAIRLGQ